MVILHYPTHQTHLQAMAGRPVAVFLASAPVSSEYCITGIEQRVATTGMSSDAGVLDDPAKLLAVMVTV
jgi:hypothetical protein